MDKSRFYNIRFYALLFAGSCRPERNYPTYRPVKVKADPATYDNPTHAPDYHKHLDLREWGQTLIIDCCALCCFIADSYID